MDEHYFDQKLNVEELSDVQENGNKIKSFDDPQKARTFIKHLQDSRKKISKTFMYDGSYVIAFSDK